MVTSCRTYVAILGMSLVVTASGCSTTNLREVVFPAHPNSFDQEGEKTKLTLLTPKQMSTRKTELQIDSGAAVDNSGAATVVAIATGFVSEWLEEEADRYEAQFQRENAEDGFYAGLDFKYAGFEFQRTTKGHETEPAFDALFEFVPSADKCAFQIRPIYMINRSAKAKVLDYSWRNPSSYLSTVWTWLLDTGDAIDIEMHVRMRAIWTDDRSETHIADVADCTFEVGPYHLTDPAAIKVTPSESHPFGKVGGWFGGVPKSANGGSGNFWLKVAVVEKDRSNARKYILKASEKLKDYKG